MKKKQIAPEAVAVEKNLEASAAAHSVIPSLVINIVVDTEQLYHQSSPFIQDGIYMMDNQLINGSTGEGTLELSSLVRGGGFVGFNIMPIDLAGLQGDTVEIMGFKISSGVNIFGNMGFPQQQPAGSAYQWLGTAMIQGQSVYQITIGVSYGGGGVKYFNWDAFLTCS
jgi:hypothetical protein